MEFRTDLVAVPDDAEVLLACVCKEHQTMMLARPHWFVEGQGRARKWQSTWDGKLLPDDWTPYAYAVVQLPDPASTEGGY